MSFAAEEPHLDDRAIDIEEDTDKTDNAPPQSEARWYAVQVASGCEKRVKTNLEQRLQALGADDRIFKIEIPQTPTVKIRKDGSRTQAEEKVFPGYVLIEMLRVWDEEIGDWKMDEEAWMVVKNTPNVINFVGAEQKRPYGRGRGHVTPVPLSPSEVERIFKQTREQEPTVKVDMEAGDQIIVLSGPFKDFEGEVIEVSPERSKLKALLSIFGRDTPVELEFNQVEKTS